jgi:predicted nucleic acid-binding protein
MSGSRFLLDTNAVVALLAGQGTIGATLNDADWIGISVITKIEFLVFQDLDAHDRELFDDFEKLVEVVGIDSKDSSLIKRTIALRKTYGLKVPDAIVGATAMENSATLITLDDDFRRVQELVVLPVG